MMENIIIVGFIAQNQFYWWLSITVLTTEATQLNNRGWLA
jgi:hypothetical protein